MEAFERPNGHLAPFLKKSFLEIAARQTELSTLENLQEKISPIEKFLGHFGFQFDMTPDSVAENLSMRVPSNTLDSEGHGHFQVISYYDAALKKRGFFIQNGTSQTINASVTKSERPGIAQYPFSLSQNGTVLREGDLSEAIMHDLAQTLGKISPAFLARAQTAWKKTFPLAADLNQPNVRRVPGYSRRIKEIAAQTGLTVELRK